MRLIKLLLSEIQVKCSLSSFATTLFKLTTENTQSQLIQKFDERIINTVYPLVKYFYIPKRMTLYIHLIDPFPDLLVIGFIVHPSISN